MSLTAYLSTEEAAEYLGITLHALRMSLHRGHIRPTGRIGQRLLFSMDDLDEQVQQNLQKKPASLPVAVNDDEEALSKRQPQRKPHSTNKPTKAQRRHRPQAKKPTSMSSIRASLDADRKTR